MKTNIAKWFGEISVIDPDSQLQVEISLYKHENGGIFGIDSSFIDQSYNVDEFDRVIICDPFSDDNDQVVLFE